MSKSLLFDHKHFLCKIKKNEEENHPSMWKRCKKYGKFRKKSKFLKEKSKQSRFRLFLVANSDEIILKKYFAKSRFHSPTKTRQFVIKLWIFYFMFLHKVVNPTAALQQQFAIFYCGKNNWGKQTTANFVKIPTKPINFL